MPRSYRPRSARSDRFAALALSPPGLPGNGPDERQRRYVLTPQQSHFVEEYVLSLDSRDAAVRAGLRPHDGSRMLADPTVQRAISLAGRRALSRQQLYLEDVLRNLVALRDADPNELVEVRRRPCRNCWGADHEPQYTDLELRHARAAHAAAMAALRAKIVAAGDDPETDPRLVPFDERGGGGYSPHRPPCRGPDWAAAVRAANPAAPPDHFEPTAPDSCPVCFGDGELAVLVKDTRNLSYGARLLYDGVKVGAGGSVEVKFRDRSWAEDRLLRYTGAFNDRRSTNDPNRLLDESLVSAVAALVERGTLTYEALPVPDDGAYVPPDTDAPSDVP